MKGFVILVRFLVGFGLIFVFLGYNLDASLYLVWRPFNKNYSDRSTDNLDKQLANSKMFKISDSESNKTSSNWWKKIILDKYKPENNFDNAVIQAKKYDYTNDSSKYNPSILPGYRNVSYSDFSDSNDVYKNTALYDIGIKDLSEFNNPNLTTQNSFSNKYYFDTNSGLTNDFSWYSADPTIVNDHNQPNRAPVLNSEYNGNFAGARSLLFGLNFGLPSSLEYSMKTISQTGTNASIADLNYQYNFSLPNPFIENTTFTASGTSAGALPTNSHYDQIKDPAKKIATPNKNDFAYYQLWRSITNHVINSTASITFPWGVEPTDDKGSSGTLKKPHIGHFFQFSPLPFNTNPNPIPPPTSPSHAQDPPPDPSKHKPTDLRNPNYNPELLKSNLIGDPPASLLINGSINTYIQSNLLSYPFYVEDKANDAVYLIHCFVFADSATGSSRIVSFYSKFTYQDKTATRHKLVMQKQGLVNDLLFNNYRSVADKDITKLNNSYKFCETMLPFVVDLESSASNPKKSLTDDKPVMNCQKDGFNQKWLNYLDNGGFSYKYDGQLKLMYANASSKPPSSITEYPKIRQKYLINANPANQKYHNLFFNDDLLNYNKNIYKNNFSQAIHQNKVEYTKSFCNKSSSSYTFPKLTPVNWILYHFLITNGASEYFDANNKDQSSELNAYNPYRYYTAIVGCQTDNTFNKTKESSSFPNPFFSCFLLSAPSVGINVNNTGGNSTTLSFSSQNLAEFTNSGKAIKDVDKLNHVYLGSGGFSVQSWIVSLLVIFILLAGSFLIYYFYRRKQIKIWRAKKAKYQRIGPQTQHAIAVDDIIHLINDVRLAPPKNLDTVDVSQYSQTDTKGLTDQTNDATNVLKLTQQKQKKITTNHETDSNSKKIIKPSDDKPKK